MRRVNSRPWYVVRWIHRRLRAGVSLVVDQALGVRTTFEMATGLLEEDRLTPFDGTVAGTTTEKPCGWVTLYRVMRWLEVGHHDAMVDFGSGAGRAVLVASLFPFRRVVGVERQEWLHRRALDNLARFRLRRKAQVELMCADAAECPLPDDVTVVFLHNPFGEPTLRRVMTNVFASLERAPRRLRIVYVNPQGHDYLIATGRCRLVGTLMDRLRPTRDWARMLAGYVYEVDPAPTRMASDRLVANDSASPTLTTVLTVTREMRDNFGRRGARLAYARLDRSRFLQTFIDRFRNG